MNVSKPNRTHQQNASRNEMQQKQSGDQHILPLDDMDSAPHRPHRAGHRADLDSTGSGADRDVTRTDGDPEDQ